MMFPVGRMILLHSVSKRDLVRTLSLVSIGLTAAMSDLYEGIDLPDQAVATWPTR